MLDSMQENPRPTRAEASDVANAVFDGTDATMLSGESANGDYPVESVATMARIDVKAENTLRQHKSFSINDFDKTDVTEAVARSVAETADNLNIKTIVAATKSGHTARLISKYRPDANILAVTFDERTRRGLSINWGVHPVLADTPASTDEMFALATEKAKAEGFAKEGDLILITAGVPVGEKGTTNVMKIQLIGSKIVDGQGVGDETVIGKAVIAESAKEANDKAVEGCVLVTKNTDKDYLPAIEKASALVVENGGLTSHAAVVGISMGIPVVVGAHDATSLVSEGEVVTVDSRRGIVYHGASNAL
jgi:pyruvate kinase